MKNQSLSSIGNANKDFRRTFKSYATNTMRQEDSSSKKYLSLGLLGQEKPFSLLKWLPSTIFHIFI
jgi:hypothetical protein